MAEWKYIEKWFDYKIEVKKSGNWFIYGYSMHKECNGVISPATSKHGIYPTERQALLKAIDEVLDFFLQKHYSGFSPEEKIIKVPKKIFDSIYKLKYQEGELFPDF